MLTELKIRPAKKEEHKAIIKVAVKSKFTSDFTNRLMFSSDAAYRKGWIWVAELGDEIVGFTCVRHKIREPVTVLYFIGVHPNVRDQGIGRALMEQLVLESPHKCIHLNVIKTNIGAVKFYQDLGYKIIGSTMANQAHQMELVW